MWTVVYISQDGATAKRLAGLLREKHILSRMRRIGQHDERQGFEVLVPQPEVDAARDLIIDNELF